MPHYLTVPEPIQVVNLVTDLPICETVQEKNEDGNFVTKTDQNGNAILQPCPPWTFYQFLARYVFSSEKAGKGKDVAKFVRRLKKLKHAATGDVFIIDDADLEKLKTVMGELACPGSIAGQLDGFFDAVENATAEDPRKKEPEAA